MITIRHTHADGTLVEGTDKGDGTAPILKAHRFRWFPSIKLWGIPQSRDHVAKRHQISAAAEALRAAGHEVAVEIDDTPRDVAEVKADRAERLGGRHEALSAKAERQYAERARRFDAADEIAQRRPFGQPIIVGHYSERGARADQRRIETNMDKGCEAGRLAAEYERRAAVVGTADAYREKPAVIVRRIEKAEADIRRLSRTLAGETYSQTPDGQWREQLEAQRGYLEHQLAADRVALEAAKDAGYRQYTAADVHKGDVIRCGRGALAAGQTVVRVSAKSVSVRTPYSWTDRVSYDRISRVECPH